MFTQDKLLVRGIIHNNICLLCNKNDEDHDHLFLQYTFSKERVEGCFETVEVQRLHSLLDWLQQNHWSSKFQKDLIYFALATTVYSIWRERNQRFHHSTHRDEQSIIMEIFLNIRYFTTSWKNNKMKENSELAINLGLLMKIFSN